MTRLAGVVVLSILASIHASSRDAGNLLADPKKDDDASKKDDDATINKPIKDKQEGDAGEPGVPKKTTTTTTTTTPKPWTRPYNMTNGACMDSHQERYVMEIKSVGGGNYYIGKIGFGSDEQYTNMLLDTGSDEIVVKSSDCSGCKGNGFNPKTSTTWKEENYPGDPNKGWEGVSYGSGDVVGQRGFDTVHAGPIKGDAMPLLVVQQTNLGEFMDTSEDALEVIAGMAPGLPEYAGERLASRMGVRRFSQCLPSNSDENGFFVVNDDEPSSQGYKGPFTSVGNYYWAVETTDFRFAFSKHQKGYKTQPQGIPLQQKKFTALLDTGTTLISLPQSILDELQKALEGIEYDCHQMNELPDLSFEFDGVTHYLPPDTYIAEVEETGPTWVKKDGVKMMEVPKADLSNLYFKKEFKNSQTGTKCSLLFTAPVDLSTLDGDTGILGMPLFRNYIIGFDFCTRQMWTKASSGDCSRAVGQHPSNKQSCNDGDAFGCVGERIKGWFWELLKGLDSIFSSTNNRHAGPKLLKMVPGKERMSNLAKSLLNKDMQGAMFEV